MKKNILRFICAFICFIPAILWAQTNGEISSPSRLYNQGKELFAEKSYAAAIPPLQFFLRQKPESESAQEAKYMLVCAFYELKDRNSTALLREYLDKYPDSPHANRIYALIASTYFFEEKYDEALALFNSSHLDLLANDERDDMTYRLAFSYLKTGDIKKAAIWFKTLKNTSPKYQEDCTYFLSYIRYTEKRYDDALSGFLELQNSPKYKALSPYYAAEIYLIKKQYAEAQKLAQSYLAVSSQDQYAAEMHRILGEVYYHDEQYKEAIKAFESYLSAETSPRRDALYTLGLSYYHTGVFSKASSTLGEVTNVNDALTQNAYLHMGLSYLQLAEKNNARMAFEQAATSNADMKVKEQAAYNYALCIRETSFSAFGESVNAFETFLNEFPNSAYTEKINSYLVEVYMNTHSYEAALKSIERITNPGVPIMEAKQKILFQLGTQMFANASFEQALDYFTRSITIGQYNRQTKADASYWRGETYYRLSKIQDAARNFNDYLALTQQPNNEMYALAHYNLGYTYFQQKNYSQAENWLLKYVELEKGGNKATIADAYNRIGDCNFQARNFNAAARYYSQAEGMQASSGDYSLYQQALVSGLQKEYTGKITLLNKLIEKYPSSPYVINALYEKGRSYVQMNNNDQAIATLKELVKKYPESPVSRKASAETGLLYYQDGKYDQAIEAYKDVATQYPGSEEARLALRDLKSIYIDTNRVDEFAALISSLPGDIHFDTNEQDSLTYTAAEKIYMRGKVEQAKESFNKYLQTFPDGAFKQNAHYYLCLIGREQNNDDIVLLHSAQLLEYPDNRFSEETLVMRTEVLFKQQKFTDALPLYKQLKEKTSTAENRLLAQTGILRCAYFTHNDAETIHAATDLLTEPKLSPELINETTYYRAKAYINQHADKNAMVDLKVLAKDTRNVYGAEAKYLVAQYLYETKDYHASEKELLGFIEQSTPHTYWLARSFILLSDVYVAMDKKLDARQYLLSLQQNYHAEDDIKEMIESRLQKLKK
ncbi:tetratricopeptide repeat protein [uncultured Bacteroides sp.]|uniref:tetratricopeptide repeat protein n=1 Tax=uncultured Bacteroides sp. TaxID=162156 RepID=UPI002AA6BC23|nr:tetratricopeptide repeat protein [uncultured Bacteroides sp.]